MSTSQKFTYKGKEYLIKKGKEYTATYKKYQREQVKAANGEMKMTAEPDYIYDMTTDRFVIKKRYINSRTGELKNEFARKGYTLNSFGNIESKAKEEPELEYAIFIEFLAHYVVTVPKIVNRKLVEVEEERFRVFLNQQKTVKFNSINKDQKINELAKKEKERIKKYLEDSNTSVISIQVQFMTISESRHASFEEVQRIKMRGASTINLSNPAIGVNHNQDNTGDCVPKAILNHVNNPKEENPRKRLQYMTTNEILRMLNNGEKTRMNNDYLHTLLDGYDSIQVMNVFTQLRIPCYALDHKRECFLHNLQDIKHNRNQNFKSFVFMSWNRHMYVVENDDFRERVFKSESEGSKMKIGTKQSKKGTVEKVLPIQEFSFTIVEDHSKNPMVELVTGDSIISEFYSSYSPGEAYIKKFSSINTVMEVLKKLLDETKEPTRFICSNEENIVHKLFYDELKKGNIHDDPIDKRVLKLFESDIIRFAYKQHIIEYNKDFERIKFIVEELNKPLIEENNKIKEKFNEYINGLKERVQPDDTEKRLNKLNTDYHQQRSEAFIPTPARENKRKDMTPRQLAADNRKLQEKGEEKLKILKQKYEETKHKILVEEMSKKEMNDKINEKLKNIEQPKMMKLYQVENASFHSLALKYFQMNYGLQLSQLGEQGDQVMNSPLNSAFNEFWEEKYPDNLDEYHGYDIRKQYSSILRNVSLGWSVYNPMNEIQPFSGTLQEGFYYVETSNYFPMKGNGWYNGEALIEYVADGIINMQNIKYEFLPSIVLNGNYFEEFVNKIYERFGTDAKQAINGFIGMLRINQSTKTDNFFFNDVDSLFMHMTDSKNTTFKIVREKEEQAEIEEKDIIAYHAMHETKYPLVYNSSPIHRKIYDIAALQIYRLAKAVGLQYLFGIKTDALYFNGGNRLEATEHEQPIGGIRYEDIKPRHFCNFKRGEAREYQFELLAQEWKHDINIFDSSHGSMITGCAGTGKSYKAKELTKYLNDQGVKYRVCAPTKAAAIIHTGGETIHKLFGFDPVSPVLNISKMNQLVHEGVKVIIVDEISMINANIWGLLLKIKKYCGFTFFGFGDAAQCAPVKEEKQFKNYFSSALCAELFDSRHIELIENYRCKNDPDFADLNIEFVNAREGRKINVSKFGKKICDRAIAYTNAQCKKHNDIIMDKYKTDTSMKVKDMWVYEGLPVKATMNGEHWSNNEQFSVIKYTADKITIRSNIQKNEKDEWLEIDVPIDYFKNYFQCAYCTTVHCAQGQTYDFEFTIYEYNVMSSNILYTALSRTTKKSNINLVFKEVPKSFVYCFINLTNNKYYVGSTIDLNGRYQQHIESDETDKFHKALRDEGLENFQFVKLFEGYLNEKSLLIKEQEFISKYNSIEQGYNSKLTTKSD